MLTEMVRRRLGWSVGVDPALAIIQSHRPEQYEFPRGRQSDGVLNLACNED